MKNKLTESRLAVIENNMEHINNEITKINNALANKYIIREEIEPLKKIIYGVVSLILIAVIGQLVALVLIK